MKIARAVFFYAAVLSLVAGPACLFAEDAGSSNSASGSTTDWKQELSSDQAAIKAQKEQMKGNAQAGKEEERALHEKIRQAIQSGDHQTAQTLMGQLKTMHQENVQQRQQDRQALKSARQELNSDRKKAWTERTDKNKDGTVDQTEKQQTRGWWRGRDKDNNPPGKAGGPGTNWENPPGPKGGPGASPNRGGGWRRNRQ